MVALRPYQSESIAKVTALDGPVVLQMPTGAGKTKTATSLIPPTGVVWFLCHRREILRQTSAALTAAGIDHAIAAAGRRPAPSARVQVCSIGSMRRRMLIYPAPDTIIVDECHHAAASTWAAIIEAFPRARVVGLTATPQRRDGQGLHEWFDHLVVGPSVADLIAEGYLSRYRLFAPGRPNLDDVPVVRGDYAAGPADEIMRDPRIVGDAVATYQRLVPGKRALAFTTSIAASQDLVARFKVAGVAATHIDGSTPVRERDAAVADLAAGRIAVLSNFGVFTEGFDLPAIDAVILLRPTKSLALYLQMVGRALRTAPGKSEALILDHAGLVFEHSFPDADQAWSLEGGARKGRSDTRRKPTVMACPVCGRAHKPAAVCPSCGYAYPAVQVAQAMEGELEERRAIQNAEIEADEREARAIQIVDQAMQTYVPAAAFGRIIGKPVGKVLAMVEEGLPTNDEGEIQVSAGLAWVAARPVRAKRPRVPMVAAKAAVPARRGWWERLFALREPASSS